MFDLDRLHLRQFDQFQPRRVFEMPVGLKNIDGAPIPAGLEFRFDHAIVNVNTGDAEIHGTGPNGEPVAFRTVGGEHKSLFVWTGREHWPQENPDPVSRESHVTPGAEAEWLRAGGFGEAAAIVSGRYSSGDWDASRRDADVLRRAARALDRAHRPMARFLADLSLSCYHAWMSQATSGGEGTAMEHSVREELKEMRKLLEPRP